MMKKKLYKKIVFGSLLAVGITVATVSFAQMHMKRGMDMRPIAVKNAVKVIVAGRKTADRNGNYDCCLKHDCDYCEIHQGYCHCEEDIQHKKPVCIECEGGWIAGDGGMPGVKAKDVKVIPAVSKK